MEGLNLERSIRLEYSLRIERIKKNYFRTKFEAHGISFYDGVVLLVIGKGIIQNQDDISFSSSIDKYRIAKIMSKLESEALITREVCATNKRKKLVNLTETGKEMYHKLSQIVDNWERLCFTDFTKDELDILQYFVKKIEHNLQELED